jgi:hypothetical protein
MTKRFLLLTAFAALANLCVQAQTSVVYNISNMFEVVKTMDKEVTVGDFVVVNGNGDMKVEKKAYTFDDGIEYSLCLKSMGKGTFDSETGRPTGCSFGFPVSGSGTVKLAILSNSSSDATREVGYYFVPTSGDDQKGETGIKAPATEYKVQSWAFEGTEGMLYFYSIKNGINFYMVSYTPDKIVDTAVSGVKADADVVATHYFNLNGMRTEATLPGIYLKQQVLSDGSVKTQKVLVR